MSMDPKQNFLSYDFVKEITNSLKVRQKLYISPLFGSSKVFAAKKLIEKIKVFDQIAVC